MAIRGGRPDDRRISPNLIVRDAGRAIAFYEKALGAEALYVSRLPDGKVLHAQLRIGDTVLLVSEENMGMAEADFARHEQGVRTRAPQTLGGTSLVLELYVDDVDAVFQRAIDAGGKVKMALSDTFYGDRMGQMQDPFGQVWALATVQEVLDPQEVDRRARELFAPA